MSTAERTASARSYRFGALGLVLAAAGTFLLLGAERSSQLVWPDPVILLAVLVLFVVAEASQIHVEGREHTLSVSISDIPLVIGLFLLPPWWLLLARLLSAAGVYVSGRRSPTKSLFNLCLYTFEIGIAVRLFEALGVRDGTTVHDWVWAFGIVLLLTLILTVTIAVAMLILGTQVGPRDVWDMWLSASLSAVMGTALALMAVVVLRTSLLGLLLLAVLFTVAALAHRAYRRLLRRHTDLGELFSFTQTIGAASTMDDVVTTLLQRAKDMLHAESAVLRPPFGTGHRYRPLADDSPVLVPRHTPDPGLRSWLAQEGLRDAMLVPLHDAGQLVGIVQVANRIGRTSTFDLEDLDLLQTLAAHAEAVWRSGRLMEQLRYDAHHDGLTDLGNRTYFQQVLDTELMSCPPGRAAGRDITPAAVLLLDLDRFKEVNDTLGHPVGDELLRLVAKRLLEHVPQGSVVARLGGDEFAVLVPVDHGGIAVASRIRTSLTVPFQVQDTFLEVGASIGVATIPADGDDSSTLLQHADVAMYAAKRHPTGVARYSAHDDRSSVHRLAMAGELRGALEGGDVAMHLQPQTSLRTGKLTSFEALARWNHPTRGVIMPDDFIPLAEQTGLIGQMTHVALVQSLAACRSWLDDAPDVGVSVNLSPRQLLDHDLAATVSNLLRENGVAPSLLTLEITEGSIMTDPAAATAALRQLRDLGVRLSVDDFGTGHSALAYLQNLPLDELKIDKSFVLAMLDDNGARTIVRSVVDLAHTLGLSVVAEGVETDAARRLLVEFGCDVMQGFLVSRALPPTQVTRWRQRHEGTALAAP